MTSSVESSASEPENGFKILVASDIHLGYKENDEYVGNDSFNTFHEILRHSEEERVDFILITGNLFHTTDPSKETLHRCMELMKQYTLGDKPIEFEVLNHNVNFHNPNINVAIPIFSIHGNCDDPSGREGLSAIDLLQTSGMLNYFGKYDSLEEVNVDPILMQKESTRIALYGLGHIEDYRLGQNMKVVFNEPVENSGKWFNIMALNQHRFDRGRRNYIPPSSLPHFLDLILWGGEPESKVEREKVDFGQDVSFYVSQPGSTVVTSMTEGESAPKHIAIVHVVGSRFFCQDIALQTVRPFVYRFINLQDNEYEEELDGGDVKEKVMDLLNRNIIKMIDEAKRKETKNPAQPTLPLIHLRVSYRNEDYAINKNRFGQRYIQQVANPFEMITMHRVWRRVKRENGSIDENAMNEAFNQAENNAENDNHVQDTVDRYFKDPANAERLKVFFPNVSSDLCRRLSKKKVDEDAVDKIINASINRAMDYLSEKMPDVNEADVDSVLSEYHQQPIGDELFKEIQEQLASRHLSFKESDEESPDEDQNRSDDRENPKTPRASRGRGGGRGRAKGKTPAKEKETEQEKEQTKGRGGGGGRGKGRGTNCGNREASPQPSTSKGLGVSTTRKQQPPTKQSRQRTSTRSKKQIYYDEDVSD